MSPLVWNSTIERRTELARGKPPTRKKRLRWLGRRRKRDRAKGLVDGPLCMYARTQACVRCGLYGTEPHHVKGGHPRRDWIKGKANVVPACRDCHELFHDQPALYREWLRREARKFGERFKEAQR